MKGGTIVLVYVEICHTIKSLRRSKGYVNRWQIGAASHAQIRLHYEKCFAHLGKPDIDSRLQYEKCLRQTQHLCSTTHLQVHPPCSIRLAIRHSLERQRRIAWAGVVYDSHARMVTH